MRRAFLYASLLACAGLGCGAGVYPSNGVKMGEALAFVSAAAAAQVAESIAEQNARRNAPVHSSAGVNVTPQCDNDGQYPCVNVTVSPSTGDPPAFPPDPAMDYEEARDYVLGYVNGVRKLNGVGPLVRDESLDAFAQAGSDELAQDHRPNQHMALHASELHTATAEVQGAPDGSPPGLLQDRIGEILLRMTGEGPGGVHHDAMLRPEWRKLGVGIASPDGRVYFTVDLAGP
jgi:uncharacterized protein YkwD